MGYGPSANAYGTPSYMVGGDSGVPVAQRPGIALPRFDQSVIPMCQIRRTNRVWRPSTTSAAANNPAITVQNARQTPEGLSELLLKSCTAPDDTVFVLFGGSGSDVIQAHNLGLNFLTCELQPRYCDIIESRLKNRGEIEQPYRHPAQLKRGAKTPDRSGHPEGQSQMLEARRIYRERYCREQY